MGLKGPRQIIGANRKKKDGLGGRELYRKTDMKKEKKGRQRERKSVCERD